MKKKITALLLCMAMLVTMLPMGAYAGDRTYIGVVTGKLSKVPALNESTMNSYVTIDAAEDVHGLHATPYGGWKVKDGTEWKNYTGSSFGAGTYVYEVEVSCRNGEWDVDNYFSDEMELYVDGVKWESLKDSSHPSTNYTRWFRSPEYTLKEAEPEVKVISQVDLKWFYGLPAIGKKNKNSFSTATVGVENDFTTFNWSDVATGAWLDFNNGVFGEGTYRTASFQIVAETGYKLADDLTINVERLGELNGRVIDLKDDPTLYNNDQSRWIAVEITLGDEEPEAQEYTVTLKPNGGKGEAKTLQTEDGKFTVPECPFEAQEGYEFDYWQHSGAAVEIGKTITLSGDYDLDAVWKPSTTPTPPTPPTEPEKGSITLTKTFSGITSVPNDITFTVESKDGKYKEVFNIGTDTGFPPVRGSDKPTYKKELDDLDPGVYTITETNYKISGYKEKVMIKIGSGEPKVCDSTEVTIGEGEAISIAITDEYVEIKHDVTFVMNGHGTAPAAQSVKDGECAVKPADPKADGYTFGGWYKDQGCTEKFEFTTQIKENTVVYAKWTKDESKKDDKDKKDDKNNSGKTDKNKTGNKKNGGSVPTGDSTQEMPFVMLLIAGLFCFTAAAARRLRRN